MPCTVLAVERRAGVHSAGKTPSGQRDNSTRGVQSWLHGHAACAVTRALNLV